MNHIWAWQLSYSCLKAGLFKIKEGLLKQKIEEAVQCIFSVSRSVEN